MARRLLRAIRGQVLHLDYPRRAAARLAPFDDAAPNHAQRRHNAHTYALCYSFKGQLSPRDPLAVAVDGNAMVTAERAHPRCGHCGRKLYVGYGGKAGRYYCQGALVNHGTARCISFGGLRADNAVGTEVLRVLKPLGIHAAVKALATQTGEISAARRQLELALQEARFSAAYARRQYDAVDPDNRLVVSELERRWNEALQVVHRLEGEIAELEAKRPAPLGEKERRHLMQLGADLELAWSHPAATAETRKRILRTALHEIIARIEGGFIQMVLHWQGGDHTPLQLKMNGAGKHRWTVPEIPCR